MDATIEQRLDRIEAKLTKLLRSREGNEKKAASQMVGIKGLKRAIPHLTHNTLNTLRKKHPQLVEKIVNDGEKKGRYIYNLTEFLKLTA